MIDEHVSPVEQLDHYRIDAVVARSAAATIFRATDLHTNQQVAIKLPHAEMEADPIFADRFRREKEVGEQLGHPGIIKIIPDHERRRPYIVLEWFEGKPLRQIMSEEKPSPERAVRIVTSVLRNTGVCPQPRNRSPRPTAGTYPGRCPGSHQAD